MRMIPIPAPAMRTTSAAPIPRRRTSATMSAEGMIIRQPMSTERTDESEASTSRMRLPCSSAIAKGYHSLGVLYRKRKLAIDHENRYDDAWLMQNSYRRVILVASVLLGSFIFLFSGGRSLADVFFFLGSITAIAAYLKLREIRDELEEMKQRVSERIEEIEYRLEKNGGETLET